MAHFARFASIYAQQAGYRKVLLKEAEDLGHPLIRYSYLSRKVNFNFVVFTELDLLILRHMCLHYGYDDQVWDLTEQYLVGTQMLVAPVLYEGATSVNVYFPKLSGSWVHIVRTITYSRSCLKNFISKLHIFFLFFLDFVFPFQ